MTQRTAADWARMLARRASAWLASAPAGVPGASPGAAATLDAATPFLLWRAARTGAPACDPPPFPPTGVRGDAALWWALLDPSSPSPAAEIAAPGPLFPQTLYDTIEVWTEGELSAAQALWWLARERRRPELRERALRAALWHIEAIQPDNATNRPWGIAVFLDLWASQGNQEARFYAETLLHNAEAGAAARTRLSAELLADAADAAALIAAR